MSNPTPMWTAASAVSFIQYVTRAAFDAGWNLHLGGGVLDKGESNSDLDILAMPRYQVTERSMDEFIHFLEKYQEFRVENVFQLPHRVVHKLVRAETPEHPRLVVEVIFVIIL